MSKRRKKKNSTIPEALRNGVLTPNGETLQGDEAIAFVGEYPRLADPMMESWRVEIKPGDCFAKLVGTLGVFGEFVDTFKTKQVSNFRLARCYSVSYPEGTTLGIHVADIPQIITRREFDCARRAHWRGFLREAFADAIYEECGIRDDTAVGILSEAARMSETAAASEVAPLPEDVAASLLAARYRVPADRVATLLRAITSLRTVAYGDLNADARYVVRHGQESKRWNFISFGSLQETAQAIAVIHAAVNGNAVPDVYVLDVTRGRAMAVSCTTDLGRDLWGPLSAFGISRLEMRATLPPNLYGAIPASAPWE